MHSLHFLKTKRMFSVNSSALLHPSHYMCIRHIALALIMTDPQQQLQRKNRRVRCPLAQPLQPAQ